ncbi:hypothetical protein POM88_036940 [Heracleum sosnowskyi]|uniref:RPW8 domain-containing protein n=1 Tax=Heracleum sosnowskyi TaxID=360622 RepID=A0AAD8MG73_9APIA|nr:hypothetical protein POM88_036940 [Heracleum sosnowskyi]
MAFIIDAALGAGFSELFKVVKVAVRDCLNFRSNLKNLESTLESVKPMFYEIGKLNRVLNRPEEETDQFIETLNRGVILVYKCSTVPYWNPYKLYTCSKKLEKLDKCIVKFFNVQVQGFVAMSSLRNGRGIKEINDKIDFVLKFFNIKYKYTSAGVCDDSLSGVSSWESVLGLPDVVFGFNKPLQDLKEMLLRDKELVKGKSKTPNAGKGIKVDKVKSKTIQRSRPKLQLKGNGAFQIRTGLSGVVIREPSLQVISSQATSKKGGKDREKVVPEPKNKALKPEANRYYIDRDESGRLLQELRGLSFNSAVLVPSPSHVRRPPTNGTFSSSNQWNSQLRKGLPGVVIREPSSQVIPSQASQHEATSTKVGKGKEKVIYQPKKKDFKPKGTTST